MQGWFNISKSINTIYHINRTKDKDHMIISIDAGKTFEKIQHPFMITFDQLGTEGNTLKLIKGIYKKTLANIVLNGERVKTYPIRSGTRRGHSLPSFLVNTVLEVHPGQLGYWKQSS